MIARIRDVALRAGVSIGTVSNVLANSPKVNPELRGRVEQAIRELQYEPNHAARSLATRSSKSIGVVISDITNPFFPLLVRGVEDVALRHGYTLTVQNTDDRLEREKSSLAVLRARGSDGVLLVCAPNVEADVQHLCSLREAGVKLVCLDRVPAGFDCDAVVADNEKGARQCVRHLHLLGHRHIAAILGPSGLQNSADRTRGYREALRECGLAWDSRLEREGDFRLEGGYRLAKDLLLSETPPTAIFAANCMMGLGVLKAIQACGLSCPQHVSLAVYDDYPGADIFRPTLTVVAQPAYDIGRRGTEMLISRLSGGAVGPPWLEILPPELIVRESTAPPRPL